MTLKFIQISQNIESELDTIESNTSTLIYIKNTGNTEVELLRISALFPNLLIGTVEDGLVRTLLPNIKLGPRGSFPLYVKTSNDEIPREKIYVGIRLEYTDEH